MGRVLKQKGPLRIGVIYLYSSQKERKLLQVREVARRISRASTCFGLMGGLVLLGPGEGQPTRDYSIRKPEMPQDSQHLSAVCPAEQRHWE